MSNLYVEGVAQPGENPFEVTASEAFEAKRLVYEPDALGSFAPLGLLSVVVKGRNLIGTVHNGTIVNYKRTRATTNRDRRRRDAFLKRHGEDQPGSVPLVVFAEQPGLNDNFILDIEKDSHITLIITNAEPHPWPFKLRFTDEPAPKPPVTDLPEDVFPLMDWDDMESHREALGMGEYILEFDASKVLAPPEALMTVSASPKYDLLPRKIVAADDVAASYLLHDLQIDGRTILKKPLETPLPFHNFSWSLGWPRVFDTEIVRTDQMLTLVVSRI